MQSAIKIYTEAGVQLDVSPTAIIELNMGGVSLLSLADRTATYTNSFKMPNTPTNTIALGFAGSPNVRQNNSINVTIEKGVFQRKAVLKVVSFDKDYTCSISYDESIINTLKSINPYTFITSYNVMDIQSDTYNANSLLSVLSQLYNNETYFYLREYNYQIPSSTDYSLKHDNSILRWGAFLRIQDWFNYLIGVTKIHFNGTLFSDTYFQNFVIFNPFVKYIIQKNDYYSPTNWTVDLELSNEAFDSKIMVSDVIKSICQIFFAEIKYSENTVTINKIEIPNNGIFIESFLTTKIFTSGYLNTNSIKYTVSEGVNENFESDFFIGEGEGVKEVMKIASLIPISNYAGYDVQSDKSKSSLILGIKEDTDYDSDIIIAYEHVGSNRIIEYGQSVVSLFKILSMSGYYSTILNPIFEKPIILDATCWLSSLTASNIINNRVISSYKLGGRYWVDSMAHDLNSGKTKMKLIKLK